jgi:hypothetical protein
MAQGSKPGKKNGRNLKGSGQVEQGGFTSKGRRVKGPIREPGKGSEEVILQRNIEYECGCFCFTIPRREH